MVERTGRSSRFLQRGFRRLYRTLSLVEPSIRVQWATFGLGNVVQVAIPGRCSGRPRRTLLGELAANGRLYLSHPNGPSEWTRNLDVAGGRLMIARAPNMDSACKPPCLRLDPNTRL